MQVTIEYFGVSGTGRNVTEAKKDAGRKIEQFIRHYRPKVYSYRGWSVVVYRNPEGGEYQLISPDDEGSKIGCSMGDAETIEQSAIRHLLSRVRKEGEYEIPEWVPASMRKGLVSDWESNDKFQVAYRQAKSDGHNECECHDIACRAMWT